MAIIKIDAFKCNKCGWIWLSHLFDAKDKDKLPFNCAKCKSSHWNEERTNKKEVTK